MDTGLLSVEHTPVLQAQLPAERDVVLPSLRLATAVACGSGCGNLRPQGHDLATSASTSCSAGRAGGWVATAVHRLYKLEGLQVRMRVRRRKRISLHRGPTPTATGGGQYWAMDFVHDQLSNGRKFRVLTVIDKWHRQCVALQADFILTGGSVVDVMNEIALSRQLPYAITVDHGTEFTSKALDEWCYVRGMKLRFIRPGKPTENAFIEPSMDACGMSA